MTGGKRIAFNSSVLYVRLIILTLLKLYLTRLLVRILGLEDFGLYNLLAGTVAMLAFLKANMSATSQRFISVSLGKGQAKETKEVFYALFVLHFVFALFVLLMIDIIGVFLVENVLNIDTEKIAVANIVVHTMAITTAITILCVPYDSVLISHENILALSILLILETLGNVASIMIVNLFDGDHLIYYTIISCLFVLFIFIIRILYTRKYSETRLRVHRIEKLSVAKSIGSYMGWSTISSVFILLRNQGYAFLFNLVGGVVINSAYGIANQVNAMVTYCVEAIMQPIRPQIMKKESAGDLHVSLTLTFFSTKCILLVCTLVIIPLFIYIDRILPLWIEEVPVYCTSFCRVLLLNAYFFCFTNGIKALIESRGKVKGLFMVPGIMHLITIAFASLLAVLDVNIVVCYSLIIVDQLVCCFYRVRLLHDQFNISPKHFYIKLFIPCILVLMIGMFFCHLVDVSIRNYMISFFVVLLLEMFLVSCMFYLYIFDHAEKKITVNLVGSLKMRFDSKM